MSRIDAYEQVQVASRSELRAWLAENQARTEGVWLVTWRKHVADKYVSWDEIVDEVLCFGWIDSLPRKLDEDRTMLLLTPRRPGSPWSGLNKRRVAELEAQGLIEERGWEAINAARQDGSWSILDDVEALVEPLDLADALDAVPEARANFDGFSNSSKKGILWWIKSAKRDATRAKRIAKTVEKAALNLRANHPESR